MLLFSTEIIRMTTHEYVKTFFSLRAATMKPTGDCLLPNISYARRH